MGRAALIAVFVALAALAALAAGLAPWPISPAKLAESLNSAPAPSSGWSWSPPQAATFRALPWPSVHIVDARLDDASSESKVHAPEARAELSLTGLLLGRISLSWLALEAPTVTLDLDRLTDEPWSGALGALPSIPSLTVTNGVIRLTSRSLRLDTILKGVEGRIDGLQLGSRTSADLSVVWRDAPFTLSASLDDATSAARGRPSALTIAIESPLGDLNFNGALAAGATPTAAGDLAMSSHDLGEALRLVGVAASPALRAADVTISGKVKVAPQDAVVDEARITSGGQTLEGAVRLARTGGRLAISGSLDAESLSLAPLFGPPERFFSPDGAWSERTFALSPLRDLDLDLRLSVGRLDAYGAVFNTIAASALLKDGALTADLIEAAAYGGRGALESRLDCEPAGVRLHMRGQLTEADFGEMASSLGWPQLSGKGDLEFAVETVGRSPAEFIAGLGGRASFALDDGALSGVNLEEALRRNQRRPLDVSKDMRIGGTAFERAALDVLIEKGGARIVNGALKARGLRADIEGAIDLVSRGLNVRLNAVQTDPEGAAPPDAARLSFDIEGPWSNPSVEPAAEGAVGDHPALSTP